PICRCDECDLVMDFDDMPDSYFAFLANQKKIAKPERIQSLLDEFHPADDERSKIRSRVGTASLSGANLSSQSLPTLPSLPSISGPGAAGARSSSSFSNTASQGGSSGGFNTASTGSGSAPLAPEVRSGGASRGGPLVYALVGVLVIAIGVLAVLLLKS